MKKIFLDLGSFTGDTIELALKAMPDFDEFIGFEPVKQHHDKAIAKNEDNPQVKLFNVAAGLECGTVDFYVDTQKGKTSYTGSTLMKDKITGALIKMTAESINFLKWLRENVTKDDFVILKVDIEGYEYILLEKLLEEDLTGLINIMYIEWHWKKIVSVTEKQHNKLIAKLKAKGFNIEGQFDALAKQSRINTDGTVKR